MLFLCIDTSKLFTFNNIAYIRDDCNVQYKDFKQYTSKVANEVVVPNSSRLEKCDIFTGRNCHSDTISNYIKRGWKLPKTIDIDKQFEISERSGYFITMNNW